TSHCRHHVDRGTLRRLVVGGVVGAHRERVVRFRAQARDARARPRRDERVGPIGVHVVAGHAHVVGRRHPIEIDGSLTDVARGQASRHARRLRIAGTSHCRHHVDRGTLCRLVVGGVVGAHRERVVRVRAQARDARVRPGS
ncbi:hypothetical protein MLD52_23280, partial [Puniceicoccaceae bacterium K14]|nr:hypothetical protein [Puniceicoccaceae bacterium K14]